MGRKSQNIAVVGLWHLGSVYAASLARMGFDVVGIDFKPEVVEGLQKGVPPIFEPELEDTIKKYRKNLRFSSDMSDLKDKAYIFITHDVEVNAEDKADLTVIKKIFAAIVKHVNPETIVVISSQIPVGTSRSLVKSLQKKGIQNPHVIYFPENLRLGTAFDSFLNPDRVIIGSDSAKALDAFEHDLQFTSPILKMNLESAEMVKHALNSYLATCISWSSEMSDLAETVGAHMPDVVKALKTEKRVSPYAPISPGLGFAGGTLGRDVQTLRSLGKASNYRTKLFDAVYGVNKDRLPMLIKKIEKVYPKLGKKKIGILGLTYKPNTNTLRRSMSVELAAQLNKKGSMVRAYDPLVNEPIAEMPFIKVSTEEDDFFKDLDMVILMNESREFLDIDSKRAAKHMKRRILIDTKNFLTRDSWEKQKFTYIGMGVSVPAKKIRT